MSKGKILKTIQLNKYQYTIRFGQALSTFGAGAMVDFKDQTLMAAAPEYWRQFSEIHDERLEALLDVEKFHLPADKESISGLPFVRFPQWYFCPRCKVFKPLVEWEKDYKPNSKSKIKEMITPKCMECHLQLVPAGIVVACENGHIDDFPWINWIHDRSGGIPCNKPLLKLKNSSSALGLEGLMIECVSCKAKASMKGAFNKDVFSNMEEKYHRRYKCSGNTPWKGTKNDCGLYPNTLQRGALNIYFPKVVSSLVIPPYSNEINTLVRESKGYNKLIDQLNDEEYVSFKGKDNIINSHIEKIAQEIHQNEDVVKIIVNNYLSNKDEVAKFTKEEYRLQEYNALIGNIPKECMSERDFKIEIQDDISKYGTDLISKVTLVKKLREVRALVGFSRINPSDPSVMSGFNEGDSLPKGFVPIKEKETNWYPAYETRGEGIFIEFDNEKINNWINSCEEISTRIELLNNRCNKNLDKNENKARKITPKFVLLHTIAHLLIKELSFQSGYDSAALTERIYCNTENEEVMSGILIYTSSGDSEGTLGGLVRQGRYDTLPKILKDAVGKARWCSSDPVCIDSLAQGRDSMNLSACHACTLISETSCEEFNVLLDRALVVGTLENKKIGFFNGII